MRTRSRQTGFTLIELIVVIAIMAAVAGLVLVNRPWRSAGLDTAATVTALSDALRLARSRAIAQDRDVTVLTAARGFSVDGGPAHMVPSEETLSPSRVIFMPDGGSTGATIMLTAEERRIRLTVNWLTGRVTAGD